MTQAEKLEALVRKAIEGGWDMFQHRKHSIPPWYIVAGGQMPTPKVVETWVPKDSLLICGWEDYYFVWEHVIFNHQFARALFGEKSVAHSGIMKSGKFTNPQPYSAYKLHLQQAVISDDPIDYMYKIVFGGVEK
jgi:hypothetical protein